MSKNIGMGAFIVAHLDKTNALPLVSLAALTSVCQKEYPTTARKDVAGMMAYLARNPGSGISLTGRRGYYAWSAPRRVNVASDPAKVAIENLLDAMAKAEPVLRRWSKIQAALDSINDGA
jgi:hypothetical protein